MRNPRRQARERRLVPGRQIHLARQFSHLQLVKTCVNQRRDHAVLNRRRATRPAILQDHQGSDRRALPQFLALRRTLLAAHTFQSCRSNNGSRRWPDSQDSASQRSAARYDGRRSCLRQIFRHLPARLPGRDSLSAVTAMARSPSTSCATFNTRAESTPPENATTHDSSERICSRSNSSLSLRTVIQWCQNPER